MKQKNAVILWVSVFLSFWFGISNAQEQKEKGVTANKEITGEAVAGKEGISMVSKEEAGTNFKQVQGTVSAINHQGIAVEQSQTDAGSYEIYLPFEKDLKVQGVKQVTDIQAGDNVLVEYREMLSKDEKGQYTKSSRTAVEVTLVKRAPTPEQQTVENNTEEEDLKPVSQH